jgi:hypothetical protein
MISDTNCPWPDLTLIQGRAVSKSAPRSRDYQLSIDVTEAPTHHQQHQLPMARSNFDPGARGLKECAKVSRLSSQEVLQVGGLPLKRSPTSPSLSTPAGTAAGSSL